MSLRQCTPHMAPTVAVITLDPLFPTAIIIKFLTTVCTWHFLLTASLHFSTFVSKFLTRCYRTVIYAEFLFPSFVFVPVLTNLLLSWLRTVCIFYIMLTGHGLTGSMHIIAACWQQTILRSCLAGYRSTCRCMCSLGNSWRLTLPVDV